MNIDFYTTFITVMQTKSFTKTAHITQLSQSTVSNRILELEKHFGQKLFIRKGNTVEATQAGIDLIPFAETMIKTHSDAFGKLNEKTVSGKTLSIGCVHAFYDSFLNDFLAGYLFENRELKLNVYLKHSNEVIQGVVSGMYDIGFSHHTSNYNNIITKRLYSDTLTFVGPRPVSQDSDRVRIADLKEVKVIHSMLYDSYAGDVMRRNNIYGFSIDISSQVLPLLKRHDAYAFLPHMTVKKAIRAGELYSCDIIDYSLSPLESHILYHKDYDRMGHPFKAFIDDISSFVN